MRRVYKTARAAVYCGDCCEASKLWPKGIADLIVTDPPYGIGWRSNYRQETPKHRRIEGDDRRFDPLIIAEVLPLLRPYRHIYMFGRTQAWNLSDLPLTEPAELVWDKACAPTLGKLDSSWSRTHEVITFTTYIPSRDRLKGKGRLSARLRSGSIIKASRTGTHLHPTRKPVDVLRPLIESSSLYGEVVLDPFAGSGSTGEAALLEGRRAILIELDPDYCRTAAERLGRLEAWLDKEPK